MIAPVANINLLQKLGEETLYSAKGHFKACDLRRALVTSTIWLCALLNVIGMFDLNPALGKTFTAIGLLGTIALLIWNEGEGKNYLTRQKQMGEAYLALHKEIRDCYLLDACSTNAIRELSERVRTLDMSEKPNIPNLARVNAKKAIEKRGETDNWFLFVNEHQS